MKTNFLKIKEDIIDWLDQYKVKNYTLIEDPIYGFVIDTNGYVDLSHKILKEIPIKFNKVGGSFICSDNELTSLDFCPTSVRDHFYCCANQLTSLKGCPTMIGDNFFCDDNQLVSLEFCPAIVMGKFFCNNNRLTSLEFCPTSIGGKFYCYDNPLLGEIQKIEDFAEILKISQEILITKEKKIIENALGKVESTEGLPNKGILRI